VKLSTPFNLLLALVLLAACPAAREPAQPAQPAQPPQATEAVPELQPSSSDDSEERNSLASLANGATVIERTGEGYLAVSAVNVIDGNPDGFWLAPPGDLPQSVTIGLPARTRITSVGLRSQATDAFHLRKARVEVASGEGAFQPVTDVTLKDSRDLLLFDVKPVDADRVRLTMLSGPVPGHEVRLDSFVVRGQELEPPTPPRLTGSWKVNGYDTVFAQSGSHVTGVIRMGKEPLHFEGGVDGNRMLRLLWTRGLEFGYAAMAVSRDGKHLSGIDWHEEPIPLFFDDAWFGERAGDAALADDTQPFAVTFLQRSGRWPLFGLSFRPDGSLDTSASEATLRVLVTLMARPPAPIRFVSHEFREATASANHTRAQSALDALRAELTRRGTNLANVQFVTEGSDHPRQLAVTQPMRELYSSVDLEIQR